MTTITPSSPALPSEDPTLNGFVMPKVIWLHDLGCGEVTWCENRDPDGEQIEAVKYVRADCAAAMQATPETGWQEDEPLRAIDFALDHAETYFNGCFNFLKAWREGDLSEWPEYASDLGKAKPHD
jgi:hypothetical protein